MKIICLTCVYERPIITELFYKAFAEQQKHAALMDIDLQLCVVASTQEDAELARKYWHEPVMHKNKPLGAKHNAGLRHMMQFEFDYMMQLGSDDVLCDGFWRMDELHHFFRNRVPVFGLNSLILYDFNRIRAKRLQVLRPFGAGRFMSRDTLDKVVRCKLIEWKDTYVGKGWAAYKGTQALIPIRMIDTVMHRVISDTEVISLWSDDINSGLDYNSETRIISTLGMHEARCRVLPVQDAVMDIKSKQNIHAYDKFIEAEPLSHNEFTSLHIRFPIVEEINKARLRTV